MDEIKRIREALASGNPALADQEKTDIIKYAGILGMDGEMLVGKLLVQVRELVDQPVAVLRAIEEYISKLGKKAALHKLSLDLEKQVAPERMVQLREMEPEVKRLRIRESLASGNPALADQEKTDIIKYAGILGMDGEMLLGKLLIQVRELADQPVAVLRAIEEYISKLGKKAVLYKLSLNLEKRVAPERMVQLREMEPEVKRLCKAWEEGNMAGITHGHSALKDQLDKYHEGLDTTKDGERVSSDLTGAWWQKAVELT